MDVRKIREYLGMTRAEFAGKVGVSVSCVESWEYGRRNPSKQAKMVIENIERGENDSMQ